MKEYEVSNGVMIYHLPNELDHFAADRIKRKSEEAFDNFKIEYLVFDFHYTRFMDSSGIGLITGRYRKIQEEGGKVYLVNVHETIDKILKMSGIYRIISKCNSMDDLIKKMVEGGYYE